MPLIGAQEIDVPSGLQLCIRVMAARDAPSRPRSEMHHVFLEGAKVLRSDLGRLIPARPANVIGIGLIGGSIGMALRQRGWRVFGSDAERRDARQGPRRSVRSTRSGSTPTAAITFVATPVTAIAEHARRALAAGCAVVTDAGSVKAPVVDAVGDSRFVGGHPMAGSEQDGIDGADPELFEGAVWVLTPTSDTADSAYTQVASVVSSFGAEVIALAPDRHDALVAVVSHVPHLTAATLMGVAESAPRSTPRCCGSPRAASAT